MPFAHALQTFIRPQRDANGSKWKPAKVSNDFCLKLSRAALRVQQLKSLPFVLCCVLPRFHSRHAVSFIHILMWSHEPKERQQKGLEAVR